jgi:hypothetical protein
MSSGLDTPGPSWHLYNALISDLTKSGHRVHLIESHSTGINPDCPENLKDEPLFTYEVININTVNKKHFVRRYLTGVLYCFKAIPVFLRQRNFDVMMIQSCPWAPFATTFAKWFIRVPLVYNSQDMFPGSSIANGAMPRRWMQKVFYAFQKIAYRNADIISVIKERAGKYLESVSLFDIYQGAQVGEGKKSMAFNLKFVADDRTLNVEEIDNAIKKVLKALNEKLGAELR